MPGFVQEIPGLLRSVVKDTVYGLGNWFKQMWVDLKDVAIGSQPTNPIQRQPYACPRCKTDAPPVVISRLTATRMLTTGIFALAMPKRKRMCPVCGYKL